MKQTFEMDALVLITDHWSHPEARPSLYIPCEINRYRDIIKHIWKEADMQLKRKEQPKCLM